ncbi:MAG: hypothetical protein LBS92_01130 [Candidatus Methanoplasma sp.]|nr:hypothetical protein [Candidatus Methanoplasma sp.]
MNCRRTRRSTRYWARSTTPSRRRSTARCPQR